MDLMGRTSDKNMDVPKFGRAVCNRAISVYVKNVKKTPHC